MRQESMVENYLCREADTVSCEQEVEKKMTVNIRGGGGGGNLSGWVWEV